MTKKIHAKDLKPGDLVFSHRTEQAMFIVSNNFSHDEKTKLTWLPLTGRGEMFSVEISLHNAYVVLNES